MAWDRATNPVITRSRLRLSSPEHVYEALEAYGDYWRARPYTLVEDERLEQELAGRNDRLIDLALAKNASMCSLVAQLYQRALSGSDDAEYDRALRLASLSNRNAVGMLNSGALRGTEARTDSELYRLATEGDGDELATLLRNPGSRGLLRAVYAREEPLDVIPDERWRLLVSSSVGNPALNEDHDSNAGPDFLAWDVHKAVFALLATAPAEPQWVITLHQLLLEVNPARVRAPDSEQAVLDVLGRWKDLKVMNQYRKEEQAGRFTSLSLAEEFRCLIAALYGRVFVDGKSVCVGQADAADVALRCAYYGCTEMKVAAMKSAHEKDGDIFTFAALLNNSVMLQQDCRTELEGYLHGDMQWLYSKRCAQIQEQYRWFAAHPLTESLAVEDTGSAESTGQAHTQFQALSVQVSDLKSSLASLSRTVFWGLAIVLVAIIWQHK
ncbi:hypothetical protein DIE18_04450 [Burkholderia sp. Bp9125]|nr:hypothetical protein DIE18_04450 [Burkholderia sp. Bp9125]